MQPPASKQERAYCAPVKETWKGLANETPGAAAMAPHHAPQRGQLGDATPRLTTEASEGPPTVYPNVTSL